jgi:4-amino-4-deoxy-L-arabinose transferase-like glycosyltransferase
VATDLKVRSSPARTFTPARIALPSWSGAAWGAIGVTALFIGITCWWLTQDRTIPIWDAGLHLDYALNVHSSLSRGDLGEAFTLTAPYPPFSYLIGSLGLAIGGIGVAPPIVAENLFFVSLLALGCYQVGRMAFGPLAGLLSVVFALGSPLIIAQFHIFMTDAPETAMVAVSIWLILATEGFSRPRASALAGLAVGVGMLTKEPFAIFVVGVVGVTAVRGGRQAWRGMAIFAVVVLVIALPWYIHEYAKILAIKVEATASSSAIPGAGPESPSGIAPPRSSAANLEWYLWNIAGWQLYLPMFLFAAVGWVWTLLGSIRRRPLTGLAPELLIGAFVAWLILTETYVHDVRYGMPLLLYLAVFGAGWITRLGRRGRIALAAVLVVVALGNTLAIDFGVGGEHGFWISKPSTALERPGYVQLYSTQGFPVGAPQRDGDLLAMLQALRRDGIRNDAWPPSEGLEPGFTNIGVSVLSAIAGLGQVGVSPNLTKQDAIFAYGKVSPRETPPCVRIDGGFGVWVRLGNPEAPGAQDYCPLPKPHFYGKKHP